MPLFLSQYMGKVRVGWLGDPVAATKESRIEAREFACHVGDSNNS